MVKGLVAKATANRDSTERRLSQSTNPLNQLDVRRVFAFMD